MFIADALSHGWRELFTARVGYLELFPRIASHLVISFDMLYWPLVANSTALAATFGLFLYAMRLSLPLSERLGQAALICLVPFGEAIYASMTYFAAVPLLFYPLMVRDVERARRVARGHYVFLAIVATTGPWALFLVPIPIALWLARRQVGGAVAFAGAHALAFGVAAAAFSMSPAGAAPVRTAPSSGALAGIAYDAMRGLFAVHPQTMGLSAPLLTAAGAVCVALCMLQAARRRPPLVLASLGAGVAIVGGGLWRTSLSDASVPPHPWGPGERYFVLLLSTICMLVLATLLDGVRDRGAPAVPVWAAALALVLMGTNGIANYSRPDLPDFDWGAEVVRSKTHGVKALQIPPGGTWRITLP